MIINFNVEKLNTLLFDFYKLTGLTISVWDSNLNQLSYQPRDIPTFCRLIKSTPLGNMRCFESDEKLCLLSAKTNQAQTHRCHAGLIDTAIPIKFKDTLLGFLMFGQAISSETNEEIGALLHKVSKELKLDETLLQQSYKTLGKYQPDRITSAANILKMATRYLWLSDMIKIENDDLIEQIDEYIHDNIDKKLTIEILCQLFPVSKNKLYELFKEHFQMTIGDYIQKVRIDKAKKLLTTSHLLIYEISNAVGIAEYNYFMKIFKKETGLTPRQYRKQPPTN